MKNVTSLTGTQYFYINTYSLSVASHSLKTDNHLPVGAIPGVPIMPIPALKSQLDCLLNLLHGGGGSGDRCQNILSWKAWGLGRLSRGNHLPLVN